MTAWRHHLRRARFALTVAVGVLLIGAAVAVGLVQVLLPLATRHPDFVAQQLSERLHRPVRFASISSEWQPSGPLLQVRDLTLGPTQPGGKSVTLPHAALKFNFGAWLRPARRWITLRLTGAELRVEHSRSGWLVVGFGNSAGESHVSVQSLPVDLDLRDLRVDIVDDARHRAWRVFSPRLKVVNVGDSLRFGGSIEQLGTRQAVTVSGRVDAAARDYTVHIASRGLDLAEAVHGLDLHGYAIRSGRGDFELWAGWRDGRLASAAARYALADVAASGPDGRKAAVAALAGVVQATRTQDGWNLAWRGPGRARADIDQVGGAIAQLRGHAGAWQVTAAARAIDAAPWLQLVALLPQVPAGFADWVARAHPHGRVDSAALAWREGGAYDATVRVSGLGAAATGAIPGLALARGTLRADNHALAVVVPPQAGTVALTDVFRKPFVFTQLGGTFVAWRDGGFWNIAADGLHFDTGTLAGSAHARLAWPGHGRRPFISAYAAVEHAQATDADLFWPYRSMPPKLIAWLDHALVAGEVTSGRVLVRGNLDAWPFRDHAGRFEASGQVRNAVFDFADDWPQATGVDAAVDFVDNQMDIVATHVKVRGVTATHAEATIPDLGHGVLGLAVQGGGTGAELLDFVRHSPVGAGALDALDGLTVGGAGKFGIDLSIPLDHAADFTLAGKVDLANADVTADKWNLKLKHVTGPLQIQGKGFRAPSLAADFRGTAAKLAIAVGSGVADPKDSVEASLDATVSAQTLVQGYPDLDGLAAHMRGVAPFHVGVNVLAGQGNAPAVPVLNVTSSLAGIALDFPAPLDKPAGTTLPLRVTLRLPPAGAPLAVALGDMLQVRGRLADPAHGLPIALAMDFGATPPARVPARGLVVGGQAPRLDLSGWIRQALAGPSGAAFPQLTQADVTTASASVFGTDLGALEFGFKAGASDDTVSVDGAAVKGTIELPTSGMMTRGIRAELQHLYWPEPPQSGSPQPEAPPPATSPVAPAAVPPLQVTIGDLRLGKARLGATEFSSAPTSLGMRIERFDSKGADFTIHAHGDWNGTRAASTSHMLVDIQSVDFGKTLAAFGFTGLMAGGKGAKVHIDGIWPGAPSSFSLASMDGSLGITVGEGRILAVKPGFGRLLGLLSVNELPSRLMLHFGDVFKSGFGFDHASATFTLDGGNAYTRDLLIKAPAAQIAMQGRTGFRDRDFDLGVDVTPHIGGTLPVVGAVIGGPVGAAAGLVVQGLIGRGINKAAGSEYRVTGSWDKPDIVPVATLPVPGSVAGAVPATSAGFPAITAIPASAPAAPATAPAASVAPKPAPAGTMPAPAPAASGD